MNENNREQLRALLEVMAQESPEQLDTHWDEVLAGVLQAKFETDEDFGSDSFKERAKQRLRDAASVPDRAIQATNGSVSRQILMKLRRPTLRYGLLGGLAAAGALLILLIALFVGRMQPEESIVKSPPKTQGQPLTPKTAPKANEGPFVEKTPAPKRPITRPPTPRNKELVAAKIEIGKAGQVMGVPTITVAGERKSAPLKPGMPLFANASIETGDADELEILLSDGTILKLGFNSEIRIPAISKTALRPDQIALDNGELWAVVRHLPSAEAFEVKTPVATARVLGTEFGLKVRNQSGADNAKGVEAVLTVKEGRVAFYNDFGSVEAQAKTTSTAHADSAPTEPKRLSSLKSFYLTRRFSTSTPTGVPSPDMAALNLALDLGKGEFHVKSSETESVEAVRVRIDGVAWKAGMRDGDRIVEIGGVPARSQGQVIFAVMKHSETALRIVVMRKDDLEVLSLTPVRSNPKTPKWPTAVESQLWNAADRLAHGRTKEAEHGLQSALRANPSAALYHALGIVFEAEDEMGPAIRNFGRAVKLRPDVVLFRMSLGWTLRNIGNYERSAEEYEAALRESPNSITPAKELAEAYLLEYREDDARIVAERLVRRFPNSGTAWGCLGEVLTLIGRPLDAEKALVRAAKISPNDYGVFGCLSNLYLSTRQFDKAEEASRHMIAIDPTNANSYDYLGGVLIKGGDQEVSLDRKEEAEQAFRRAIELDPGHSPSYGSLGRLLEALGRLPEAEDSYRKAIDTGPALSAPHVLLGNLLRSLGRFQEAEAEIRIAIKIEPESRNSYLCLGDVLVSAGRMEEAEQAFRKVIALDPKLSNGYGGLAQTLALIGRLDEAERAYRKVIALEPTHSVGYAGLGDILARTGRLDEAEKAYRKAIVLDPKKGWAHGGLGNVLSETGRLEEAEQAYREVLRLEPGNPSIRDAIACNLAERGIKLEEALGFAEESVKAAPMNLGFVDTLGWVQFKRKAYIEAEAAFLRVIKLLGSNANAAETWAHLGAVYEATDRRQKAIDAYGQALKLNPEWKPAQEGLRRLGGIDECLQSLQLVLSGR